jgi:hypothetical protein
MDVIILVGFYIFWFGITGFIVINPVGAWELLGKWQATRYPSKKYFRLLRVFGFVGFLLPILYFITQFFEN